MEKLSSFSDLTREEALRRGVAFLGEADAFHRDAYLGAIGWLLAAFLLPLETAVVEERQPLPPPSAVDVAFIAARFFSNTTSENFQALKDVVEAWDNAQKTYAG